MTKSDRDLFWTLFGVFVKNPNVKRKGIFTFDRFFGNPQFEKLILFAFVLHTLLFRK